MTESVLDRATCLRCGYRLFGLPESRCPECGTPFDPNDPATLGTGRRRGASVVDRFAREVDRWVVVLGGRLGRSLPHVWPVTLVWLVTVGLDALLATLTAGTVIIYFIARRARAALAVLAIASPVTAVSITCATQYLRGSAAYVVHQDYLLAPCGSIDPLTRCYRRDAGGCGTRDHGAISELERALVRPVGRLMFSVVGPPPGAYDGPYPGEAEAVALARAGSPARVDPYQSQWRVGGWRVPINDTRNLGSHQEAGGTTGRMKPTLEPILGTVVGNRCLVLRVPEGRPGDKYYRARIVLIDVTTGHQFGLYEDWVPLAAGRGPPTNAATTTVGHAAAAAAAPDALTPEPGRGKALRGLHRR